MLRACRRRLSVPGLVPVAVAVLLGTAGQAVAQSTCPTYPKDQWVSGCAWPVVLSADPVETGGELTVTVFVGCGGGAIGVSRALRDQVYLDGVLLPASQVSTTMPGIWNGFFIKPIITPGIAVTVPQGPHTLKVTIDPAAPNSCPTMAANGRSLTGPFVSVGGEGGTSGWSSHVPFAITRVPQPMTVNSTGDDGDLTPGDESCDTGGVLADNQTKECTLRAAIEEANFASDRNTIRFGIPVTGPDSLEIYPSQPLPQVTWPVTIDATTQGDSVLLAGQSVEGPGLDIRGGSSLVKGLWISLFDEGVRVSGGGQNVIEGNTLGHNEAGTGGKGSISGNLVGLVIRSPGNVIRSNTIAGNRGEGIVIEGPGAQGNFVLGNFVGTISSGLPLPNRRTDLLISDAPGTMIGGTSASDRNVLETGISINGPNATGTVVVGNYLGVAEYLGNVEETGGGDVSLGSGASNNRIGGAAGAGNVFAGMVVVDSAGTGNKVQGNRFRIRPNGVPLGSLQSSLSAIQVRDSVDTLVGGTSPGEGNIVTGYERGLHMSGDAQAAILQNTFSDTKIAIDLGLDGVTPNDNSDFDSDSGPNGLQNYPLLQSVRTAGWVTTVTAQLSSAANTTYRVEFFSNLYCLRSGYGAGEIFLTWRTMTTNAQGFGEGDFVLPQSPPIGEMITATATAPDGSTSEFSACRMVDGFIQTDADGVSDEVENGAPGDGRASGEAGTAAVGTLAAGDGNADGTPDAQQSHVASLPLFTGAYITPEPAAVLVRYLRNDGATFSQFLALGGRTRATIDPETIAGLETAEFSTIVEANRAVVADRTMSWNAGHYGSHAETGVPAPGYVWYLAEGATHSGFDLFYLFQNPNPVTATVRVTFLRPAPATSITKSYTVAANSRLTVRVNDADAGLASTDVSAIITATAPIVVERAMYRGVAGQVFGAGHESAGIQTPATQWFLAEGATGSFFDLFVLIANPGEDAATIEARYLLPDGTVVTRTHTVPGASRSNIWVDLEAPELANTAVSTTITSTNGVPVIVERAMWWAGASQGWYEAHNSAGATETGVEWALADGEVGGPDGVETYVLIANTSATAGTAQVTLVFEDGTTDGRTYSLAPNSRFNVAVASEFSGVGGRRFGVLVESLGPTPAQIVVERAMYSNAGGVTWAAGTNALGTKLR